MALPYLFVTDNISGCAGMLVEKFNKSDKEACAAVASVLADRLKELGYSSASLQPRVKYHGRKKAFVDALRQKGVKV
jgi:ribosomal protein L18